ncbi:MAG: hypothetical protein G01um101466_255 [Parcubacteria group bacterium Gr01-1014_66]|nr:MAG: hypothetical protein G01um101466_255 [Parcubacteria group bacterium Gr01-1014_66]
MRARSEKKVSPLSIESFERPSVLVRLEIKKVLAMFRSGIHRSLVGGAGSEFKSFRPYDPSDPLRALDTTVAARFSEHPDVEPMSRTYYAEKEITVIFMLDCGDSMNVPPRKMEHVACLVWLFALSAFRYGDRFRLIPFSQKIVRDSFWISNEGALDQFCKEMRNSDVFSSSLPWIDNAFSYLAQLSLHDAILVIVADFCEQWEERINALRLIGTHEHNVQPMLIALDEWQGFTPSAYGAAFFDPITRRTAILDMRKQGDMARYAYQAQQRMSDIAERVRPLGISFISIPLIADPIAIVYRAFLKMGRV